MTPRFSRVVELFVAPASDRTPARPLPTARPSGDVPRAAVIGRAKPALPVAGALATALRGGRAASPAVVCVWAPAGEDVHGMPAPEPPPAAGDPTLPMEAAGAAAPAPRKEPGGAAARVPSADGWRARWAPPRPDATAPSPAADGPGVDASVRRSPSGPAHTPAADVTGGRATPAAAGAAPAAPHALAPGRAAASAHLAMLGARRVAGRLAAVGLPAAARGRLVWCRLPVRPEAAAAALALAEAVSPGVVVLVVAGARPAALEPALDACDHVAIVAGAGEERLAEAALATLRAPGRAFVARPLGGPARRPAGLGLVRLRFGPDRASPDKLARRHV